MKAFLVPLAAVALSAVPAVASAQYYDYGPRYSDHEHVERYHHGDHDHIVVRRHHGDHDDVHEHVIERRRHHHHHWDD